MLKKANFEKDNVSSANKDVLKDKKYKLAEKFVEAVEKWIIKWKINWTREIDDKWNLSGTPWVWFSFKRYGNWWVHLPISLDFVKSRKNKMRIIKKKSK